MTCLILLKKLKNTILFKLEIFQTSFVTIYRKFYPAG